MLRTELCCQQGLGGIARRTSWSWWLSSTLSALTATSANLAQQAGNHADTFRACVDTPACDMVMLWGFTDLSSWIPNTFSGQGAATLFDANFQAKPAYVSVNDLLGRS